MFMKIFNIACVVFLIGLMTACQEDSPNEAVEMKLDNVSNVAGYSWFKLEYENFLPETATINLIKLKLSVTEPKVEYKFYVYARPMCSCEEISKYFPKYMKIITQSGVLDTNYHILSMKNTESLNPLSTKVKLNVIPALIIMKNGIPKASVIDTLLNIQIKYPDSTIVLEKLLYDLM